MILGVGGQCALRAGCGTGLCPVLCPPDVENHGPGNRDIYKPPKHNISTMSREFTEKEIEIFNKLAPEAGGNLNSPMGHPFPFILRPVSHRFAESAGDFKERIMRLSADELDYLVNLALEGKEEIRSLDPDDIDAIMEVIAGKISPDRARELKEYLGLV